MLCSKGFLDRRSLRGAPMFVATSLLQLMYQDALGAPSCWRSLVFAASNKISSHLASSSKPVPKVFGTARLVDNAGRHSHRENSSLAFSTRALRPASSLVSLCLLYLRHRCLKIYEILVRLCLKTLDKTMVPGRDPSSVP